MNKNFSRELIDFLSGHGKRCIAVLEAYLDESGTHGGSPVVCVGGYVGNRKEWYSFDKEWHPKLKKAGVSYFHTTNPKCSPLKMPLALAIEKRNLKGMVCSINSQIYNLQTNAQFRSSMGNPYAVCTFSCAIEICKWAEKNKFGHVSFIIEEGQPNAKFVVRILTLLMNNHDFNIAGVMLGRKEDFLPLQAADFLSHTYSTKEQPWLAYLTRSNKVWEVNIPENHFEDVSIQIKKMIGQQRYLRKRERKVLKK